MASIRRGRCSPRRVTTPPNSRSRPTALAPLAFAGAPLIRSSARPRTRIDPHPAFRGVELSSKFEHGRGRLKTTVHDTLSDVSVARPGTVLSSSQLNALAASIFLALNLSIARPPLASVLLDDPLQSLDDVNLLGLVDLLRRTKGTPPASHLDARSAVRRTAQTQVAAGA